MTDIRANLLAAAGVLALATSGAAPAQTVTAPTSGAKAAPAITTPLPAAPMTPAPMTPVPTAKAPTATVPSAATGSPAMAPTAGTPATAAATTPVAATAGMMVKDATGGAVGTVTKVGDGFVTVKTDTHEANLPTASFSARDGGLLLGMTQAELNASIEKQDTAAAALFKVGTKVSGSAGADAGTISALDSKTVTLKLLSGKVVRVPRSGIAASGDGLVIGMTAAELDTAAGPATKTTTKKSSSAKKTTKK